MSHVVADAGTFTSGSDGFAAAFAGAAAGVDRRDHLVGDDRVTIVLQHLREHARGGRRHFEHDLVGLELDQDFVLRDGFAGLLLPLQHGRFRNRFGELGDFDFYDSHVNFLDA